MSKMGVFMSAHEEMNVFVKPDEQCRACSNIVMARKRTFRGTGKELTSSTTHHLNHLINSKQRLAGKMKQSAIRWDNNDLLPIEWRFIRFSNSYISLIKRPSFAERQPFSP